MYATEKDTVYSWVLCISASLTLFIMFGSLRSGGVIFVALHEQYETPKSVGALMAVATFGSMFGTSVISGALVHVMGFKKLMVFGSLISFLAVFINYFITDGVYFIGTIGVLQGIGLGMSLVPALTIANHFFDKYLGAATGIVTAGSPFGAVVLPPLSEYFIKQYGINSGFLLISGVILHMVPLALVIRDPVEVASKSKDKNDDLTFLETMKNILNNRYTVGLFLMNPGLQFSLAAFSVATPDFAVSSGATLEEASYLISIAAASDSLARFSMGFFLDKEIISLSSSAMIFALINTASFFLIGLVGSFSYAILAVLCGLFGVSFGAWLIHLPVASSVYLGKEYAHLGLSITFLLAAVATFCVSPLLNFALKDFPDYRKFYFIVGGVNAVVVLYWLVLSIIETFNRRRSITINK